MNDKNKFDPVQEDQKYIMGDFWHDPDITKHKDYPALSKNPNKRRKYPYTLKQTITLETLYQAFIDTARGKNSKRKVYDYSLSLGKNLVHSFEAVRNGTYVPMIPTEFYIKADASDKKRKISVPRFPDSVVQRALYNEIYDTIDRKMIYDSYGCRKGKGTLKAANRLQHFMRKSKDEELYYVQLDIKSYYYTIMLDVLEKILNGFFKDKAITDFILAYANGSSESGLTAGNLMTQLIGIIYLNPLDHFIKRVLKVKHYIRYVDDMVCVGLPLEEAHRVVSEIERFAKDELGLNLSKVKIHKLRDGINFVGYRTFIHTRFVRPYTIASYKRAVKKQDFEAIVSYLAYVRHTGSYKYFLNILWNKTNNRRLFNKLNKEIRNDLFIFRNNRGRAVWNNENPTLQPYRRKHR